MRAWPRKWFASPPKGGSADSLKPDASDDKTRFLSSFANARLRLSGLDVAYLLPYGPSQNLAEWYLDFAKNDDRLPYFDTYSFPLCLCPSGASYSAVGVGIGESSALASLLEKLPTDALVGVLPSALDPLPEAPTSSACQILGSGCPSLHEAVTLLLEIYLRSYPFQASFCSVEHKEASAKGAASFQKDPQKFSVGDQVVVTAFTGCGKTPNYFTQRNENFPLSTGGRIILVLESEDYVVKFPPSKMYRWSCEWKQANEGYKMANDEGIFHISELSRPSLAMEFSLAFSAEDSLLPGLQTLLSGVQALGHAALLDFHAFPREQPPLLEGGKLRDLLHGAFRGSTEEQGQAFLADLAEFVSDLHRCDPSLLSSAERKLLEERNR